MKRSLLLLQVFVCTVLGAVQYPNLAELDRTIADKHRYDVEKQNRLSVLRCRLDSATESKQDTYPILLDLFEEYKSYHYDSACLYVDKLYDVAVLQHDKDRMEQARIKRGFALLSAGLFKECADLMAEAKVENMSCITKIDYYITYGRLMYDMADYSRGELMHDYTLRGNELISNALELISPMDTALYWENAALLDMKQDNRQRAVERFRFALAASSITAHEKAINYSSMAYIYSLMDNQEEAIAYNALAAQEDIRSSTKEIVALSNLAQMLYRQGYVEHAARYIRSALDDVQFYNARHRQLSISQILPIIEQQQLLTMEEKNHRIEILSFCLYVLLAVLLVAFILLYNRMKALQQAKQTISAMNASLMEANKIRNEYIGTLLCLQMELINQLNSWQQLVRKRVQEKRYDSLLTIPHNMNAQRKKNEFYKRFDEMFLQIFPHFVDNFNALLREEDRIVLAKGELLNTPLRIYALIRLGITDNEQISQVLDYSVNTIYTYKTRVKNRSDLSTEDFRNAVMSIPSFA
ncbi:MAG: DUF6377 domain-containing protein [Paludibacter sp.]|nr:DUF6377 domain-containing protein [Bacteroidales bacterium]MCM1069631.1 DUF6377 domain-containing protein [Prevotella sp.]MCM1354277.1 DUF6377 domain-containing protein [Bacteroides sp.]MCM1443116.1 DUF6377 domain-containing protein [Muribaculum sp.]MCM1482351.1 DUF6377 domain-containing protein [Paludibacter sp.]